MADGWEWPPRPRTNRQRRRYKQSRQDPLLLAAAAARRMEIAAENAADSYARAIKNAAEEQPAKNVAKKKTG